MQPSTTNNTDTYIISFYNESKYQVSDMIYLRTAAVLKVAEK